jgi:hypothetical protein
MNLKQCPFCESEAARHANNKILMARCKNIDCYMYSTWIPISDWQSRPIEDDLREQIEVQRILYLKELEAVRDGND